jgi:xanthine dehydrogenase accessory factor
MNEFRRLREAADRLEAEGLAYAVATLVKVEGSAYRRPGARLIVEPGGGTVGMISGGCLEREIAHHAAGVLESGHPRVVRFSAPRGEDPFGTGTGCGGTVHVLLQRVLPGDPAARALELLAEAAASGLPQALATVFRAEGARTGEAGRHLLVAADGGARGNVADPTLRGALAVAGARVLAKRRGTTLTLELPGGEAEALVECARPPIRLVVFGNGPDVEALVRQGAAVGWHVVVVGTSTPAELRAQFAGAAEWVSLVHADEAAQRVALTERTAAVVATHGYARDRALTAALLRSPVPYVGVIGSRRRFRDLLGDLAGDAPRGGATRARLFGPAGLDLGAETPGEIALAVVAEAHAVLAGRSARPLRGLRRTSAPLNPSPAESGRTPVRPSTAPLRSCPADGGGTLDPPPHPRPSSSGTP